MVRIDESDEGLYDIDRILSYDSRKQAAESQQYTITRVNDLSSKIQRVGGGLYYVSAYRDGVGVMAGCSCYDFSEYGEDFGRACVHIWAAILTGELMGD